MGQFENEEFYETYTSIKITSLRSRSSMIHWDTVET